MTDWSGGNIDEMNKMADELRNVATEVEALAKELTSVIHAFWWKGPDADRFRSEWDGTHQPSLGRLGSALLGAQDDVRRQADDQRRTSGD